MLIVGLLLCLCACSGGSKFCGTWIGTDDIGKKVEFVIKSDGKGVRDSTTIFEWEVVSENTIAIQWDSTLGTMSAKGTLENGTLTIESGNWIGTPYVLSKQ